MYDIIWSPRNKFHVERIWFHKWRKRNETWYMLGDCHVPRFLSEEKVQHSRCCHPNHALKFKTKNHCHHKIRTVTRQPLSFQKESKESRKYPCWTSYSVKISLYHDTHSKAVCRGGHLSYDLTFLENMCWYRLLLERKRWSTKHNKEILKWKSNKKFEAHHTYCKCFTVFIK